MEKYQKFLILVKIIFVSLHQLINQVVKGVTGSSFRRSLLFYSLRTLSKVSLWCAVSRLDRQSIIRRSPVFPFSCIHPDFEIWMVDIVNHRSSKRNALHS